MPSFTSYYLYQRYEKVGDGEWTPTYPNEYSISGDTSDPMPLVIKTTNDPNCGWYEPIYRWTDTDDTICIYEGDNPYANDYLTFEILSAGTITWKASNNSTNVKTISYSLDNGQTWNDITSSTGGSSISVAVGDIVKWRGVNDAYGNNSISYYNSFGDSTAYFNVYGNIMSLISGSSFQNATELRAQFTFEELFKSANVVSAENLVLPATTLASRCYQGMFSGCTSLTDAPELPSTSLAYGCYTNMFLGCESLTVAPELPATTMADYCYMGMFNGCTSLTTAPELPATTLANSCYASMFNFCSSLTEAPELPATTLAVRCYIGMFEHCTSLVEAPNLPAATLVERCYYGMFAQCTSLNLVTCLATDISASACTVDWLYNVSPNGTFVKASSMSNWTTGYNGIPNNWTIQNA